MGKGLDPDIRQKLEEAKREQAALIVLHCRPEPLAFLEDRHYKTNEGP